MPQTRKKKKTEEEKEKIAKPRKRAKKEPKLKPKPVEEAIKETPPQIQVKKEPKPAEKVVVEVPKKIKVKVEPQPKPAKQLAVETPQKTEETPKAEAKIEPQPPQPLQPPPTPIPSPPALVTEKKEMPQKTVLKITPESARFKYEIKKIPGAERLMLCFQCGTCTADCPVARFNEEYRPRKILRMTQLGIKDQVLKSDSIWLCAACYTCVDRCPQGVEISSILRALRHLVVKEGMMPPLFKELGTAILQTGYAFKIPELRIKKRGDVGLPPLPKGNIEDIAKLFNATGFSKLLETSKRS